MALRPEQIVTGHEFFCIGGVTIHGIIGTRDYNDFLHYEQARGMYINEARWLQMELQLTDEQMLEVHKYSRHGIYRGTPLYTIELRRKEKEERERQNKLRQENYKRTLAFAKLLDS